MYWQRCDVSSASAKEHAAHLVRPSSAPWSVHNGTPSGGVYPQDPGFHALPTY